MRWTEIVAQMQVLDAVGDTSAEVRGVQYDSRRVQPGDVFVAMRGGSTDGNRYVGQALERGAAAVITDSREVYASVLTAAVPRALVGHGRRALAEASSAVFGRPQDRLKVSAVTGTNGKTTTAFLLEQLLASAGRKCVLLGTVETRIAGVVRESEHTTPESRDLLALFAEAVAAGCTEVVMEMSSHALEQERVWGIPVDVAMYTNLTQDHLDFHGTMEAYAAAKARLFAGVGTPPPRVAVINQQDAWSRRMIESFSGQRLMTYGVGECAADYRALNVRLEAGETHFNWYTPDGSMTMRSPLTGRVNVYNLLAAMCAALARGMTLQQIAAAVPTLGQVPGRFEVVPGSREAGFTVVVDYAHTPDALENLIELGRALVAGHGGRVITLFGCGGDRDRTKRPKMGKVAGQGSDLVVVTSDNPRSEQPSAIIDEVLTGVRETKTPVVVEADRRVAIQQAIRCASVGDIVLLAGKGHEKVQIFADRTLPFDDVEEAAAALRERRKDSAQ